MTSSRGGAKPLISTNTRSCHWLWWNGTEKQLSLRKFPEVFPAARSLSTLSSVLRMARLHRWTYSLEGFELKLISAIGGKADCTDLSQCPLVTQSGHAVPRLIQ